MAIEQKKEMEIVLTPRQAYELISMAHNTAIEVEIRKHEARIENMLKKGVIINIPYNTRLSESILMDLAKQASSSLLSREASAAFGLIKDFICQAISRLPKPPFSGKDITNMPSIDAVFNVFCQEAIRFLDIAIRLSELFPGPGEDLGKFEDK